MGTTFDMFYGTVGFVVALIVILGGLTFGISGKERIANILSRFAGRNWMIRGLFICGVFLGNVVRTDASSIIEGALIGCIASFLLLVLYLIKGRHLRSSL